MNANVTNNKFVNAWIAEMAEMVDPSEIILIDGTEAQAEELRRQAIASGELIKLNEEKYPNCYLHRTAINDMAAASAPILAILSSGILLLPK